MNQIELRALAKINLGLDVLGRRENGYHDVRMIMQSIYLRMAAGALGAMMSGSGPTVFGLFENRAAAKTAQRKIREKALTKQVYITNIHSVRRK